VTKRPPDCCPFPQTPYSFWDEGTPLIFSYFSKGVIIKDFIVVRATEGESGLKNLERKKPS
jgi:hypothetical protein